MRTLDVWATIVVLAVSFGFVIVRFKMLVTDRRDPRSIGMWLFGLTLTIALLFRTPFVYAAFDTWTGFNNLAWFVSCVFCVLTVYVYVESCASVSREEYIRPLQWITYGLLLVLLIIAVIFWTYIARTPEYYYPGDLILTDSGSLVIKTVMLTYALLVVLIPTQVYYRLFKVESVLSTKIRWFFKVAVNLSGIVLFSSRLLMALSGYFINLPGPIVLVMGGMIETMQLVIVFWPLAFLSSRSYVAMARGVTYLKKLWVLQNLLRLHRACQALPLTLTTPVLLNPMNTWDYIRHPDLCIYNMIIAVLDYKRCLKHAGFAPAEMGWLQALLNTNDDTDFQAQVQAYSQLGKSLT